MKEYPDDIPWREIIKEAIPLVVVLVVYFCVMAAISAPSIAWMAKENGTVKNEKVRTSTLFHSSLCLFPFQAGGAA